MIDLLLFLNTTIEYLLRYDVNAKQQLQKMEGRSLCWCVQDVGLTVVCKVVNGQLMIDDKVQTTQVRVDASVGEMFDLWQNYDGQASINLHMQGNPLALQDFAQFFKSLKIDWEALLESYIGTSSAHFVGRFARESAHALMRIKEDIIAYRDDERRQK